MPRSGLQALHYALRAVIEDASQFKRKYYALHLDFRKAYDSVEIWALIKTLVHYGFDNGIINMIKAIYSENSAFISTPVGVDPIPINIIHQPSSL